MESEDSIRGLPDSSLITLISNGHSDFFEVVAVEQQLAWMTHGIHMAVAGPLLTPMSPSSKTKTALENALAPCLY